jgi:hypothetical protein
VRMRLANTFPDPICLIFVRCRSHIRGNDKNLRRPLSIKLLEVYEIALLNRAFLKRISCIVVKAVGAPCGTAIAAE